LRFHNPEAEGDRLYDREKLRVNLESFRQELGGLVKTKHKDQQDILNALKSIIKSIEDGGAIDPKEITSDVYKANSLLTNAVRKSTKTTPTISAPLPYAVIKDLGKGAVTPVLLDVLAECSLIDSNTVWFISSKRAQPRWLEEWNREKWGEVALWFIPPKAIDQLAFREPPSYVPDDHRLEIFPTDWFARTQRPVREAMEGLEKFLKHYFSKQQEATIVAMPKGLSVLGVTKDGDVKTGYCQAEKVLSETEAELTGRASMFFSALIIEMIHRARKMPMGSSNGEPRDMEGSLAIALESARAWVDAEISHLRSFDDEKSSSGGSKVIGYDPSLSYEQSMAQLRVRRFPWDDEIEEWEMAHQETGIIERGVNLHLDIWRAMCHLDGYIETVERRQRDISMLVRRLKEFSEEGPRAQSFSALLTAKPGSGKSYFVSRLVRALGLLPLNFNITQLVTREDLISCFDVIASTQAQEPAKNILVFFDEINSLVNGAHIYDLFLSVLEDGAYLRNGQLFKLKPCIWFLAGTKSLQSHQEVEKLKSRKKNLHDQILSSKAPDLHSRLTIKSLEIDTKPEDLKKSKEEIRRGFLYHGALQLQNHHSDITRIALDVLLAFYLMDLGTSVRKIAQHVKNFRDIQYGEVKKHCMPTELREVLNANRDRWEGLKGRWSNPEKLVQIHRQPYWPE
jgi:hypothetical protein